MSKICFLTPSLAQGGVENSISVMANEMTRKGNQVEIICFYNHQVFYNIDDKIVVHSPTFLREKYSTLIYYTKILLFIRKKIKSMKPEIVVSYGDYINFISILACLGLKIPVYISDRSSPTRKFPPLVNFLRRVLYPMAKGIIVQTEHALKQKRDFLGKRYQNFEIIPNAIRPMTHQVFEKKENIILSVARHDPVKRLDILIDVFSKLPVTDWKLIIAGNYAQHTDILLEQVRKLNIEDRIEFLGPVKDIERIYQKSKIFVLTSKSEGFPNALIEAMSHGLACLSFDIIAGPSDVIINMENGILIPDNDTETLKNKIIFLIENESERLRISKEAMKIAEKLSIEKIGRKFYHFISTK